MEPASIFEHWVCNYTLQGKQDIEPAIQLHSEKEVPPLSVAPIGCPDRSIRDPRYADVWKAMFGKGTDKPE